MTKKEIHALHNQVALMGVSNYFREKFQSWSCTAPNDRYTLPVNFQDGQYALAEGTLGVIWTIQILNSASAVRVMNHNTHDIAQANDSDKGERDAVPM